MGFCFVCFAFGKSIEVARFCVYVCVCGCVCVYIEIGRIIIHKHNNISPFILSPYFCTKILERIKHNWYLIRSNENMCHRRDVTAAFCPYFPRIFHLIHSVHNLYAEIGRETATARDGANENDNEWTSMYIVQCQTRRATQKTTTAKKNKMKFILFYLLTRNAKCYNECLRKCFVE